MGLLSSKHDVFSAARFFNSSRSFDSTDEFIPSALKSLKECFESNGFKFRVKSQSLHKTVVEVQKGNILHQALGLRNGLEITFTRHDDSTDVEVKNCLIENHLIGPALVYQYIPQLRIPILLSDGLGLIMQTRLPELAMAAIEEAYAQLTGNHRVFCPYCGNPITCEDGVCDACGKSVTTEVLL